MGRGISPPPFIVTRQDIARGTFLKHSLQLFAISEQARVVSSPQMGPNPPPRAREYGARKLHTLFCPILREIRAGAESISTFEHPYTLQDR